MEMIVGHSDESWNIDWSLYGSSDDQCYNYNYNSSEHYHDQCTPNDQFSYQLDFNSSQLEWNLEAVYSEYSSLYPQLKPLMNLAEEVLDPETVQQFQNKLDIYDANINYLEASFNAIDPTYDYLLLNDNEQYYEQLGSIQESQFEQPLNKSEQWSVHSNYDLNQIPVEYIDYNNNHAVQHTVTDSCNYEIVTLDNQSYELDSIDSLKSIDNDLEEGEEDNESIVKDQLESLSYKLDCELLNSEVQQSDNPDSSSDVKKKRRKKAYTKKSSAESSERRVWYRCGWEGCSFGSYYNGVVKRHSFKRHRGEVRIAQSESDSMHRFKCDWPGCDVSLVAYHKLVEHKRRHTGEKPFGCKWKACQYSTGRLYSLIIHERVHKAEHLE